MKNLVNNLPDHEQDLEKALELLKKVTKGIKWYEDVAKPIPSSKVLLYVSTVDAVLGIVADLSESRFEIRDILEEHYTKQYVKNPKLGKKLFVTEYEKLHKPYDKVKNKCFDLLSKLDVDGKIVEKLAA